MDHGELWSGGVIAGLADEALVAVAEFDLAAAVQEDAEPDQAGVRRDLGGDLVLGPRAASGGGGDVAGRVYPGICAGCPGWPGLARAGGTEC